MKREYRKPYLAVESFQLDAAVASGCPDKASSPVSLNSTLDNCSDSKGGYLFGPGCEMAGGVNVVSDNYYNTNHNGLANGATPQDGSDACYHAIQYRSIYMNS